MTNTMSAVVWDGEAWPSGLELRTDVPLPEIRPGWVLVRNRAAGICGSDLHLLGGHARGAIPDENLPAVLGHENAGIVEAVGCGVTGLQVGDSVAGEPLHGCHELGRVPVCVQCQIGQYHLCEKGLTHVGLPFRAMLPGGYGEYSIYHASRLFPIPEGVSFSSAALLDVLAVGVHALEIARPGLGDTAVVWGCGVIGLDIIQCLRACGVTQVVAVAKHAFQAEAAREVGAAHVIHLEDVDDPVQELKEVTGGRGVDIVYEGVGGNTDVINQAIASCKRGGRIVMTGIFLDKRPIDLRMLLGKEIALLGANSYSRTGTKRDYEVALKLLGAGQVSHESLVTHTGPLSQWRELLEAAFDKKTKKCLRAVFLHE